MSTLSTCVIDNNQAMVLMEIEVFPETTIGVDFTTRKNKSYKWDSVPLSWRYLPLTHIICRHTPFLGFWSFHGYTGSHKTDDADNPPVLEVVAIHYLGQPKKVKLWDLYDMMRVSEHGSLMLYDFWMESLKMEPCLNCKTMEEFEGLENRSHLNMIDEMGRLQDRPPLKTIAVNIVNNSNVLQTFEQIVLQIRKGSPIRSRHFKGHPGGIVVPRFTQILFMHDNTPVLFCENSNERLFAKKFSMCAKEILRIYPRMEFANIGFEVHEKNSDDSKYCAMVITPSDDWSSIEVATDDSGPHGFHE